MNKARATFNSFSLTLSLLVGLLLWSFPLHSSDDCSYDDDAAMAKEMETCKATAGKIWDCQNNRCVYDQTTTTMKDTVDQCAEIESESDRKACYDAVAMGAAKEEGLGSENYSKSAAKSAELLGWANLIWGALMGGSQSQCMSVTIMKWTGLAATAGDLYNYFFLSDKVKKLQEEYSKKAVAEESYDAQKEAFDYLLKEQQTIAKVAKQKNIIYTVAAAGYTAAAGMAVFESAKALYDAKMACFTTSDGGALSCAEVMGKSATEVQAEKDSMKSEPELKKELGEAESSLESMKANNATPDDIKAQEAKIESLKSSLAAKSPQTSTPEVSAEDSSKSTTIDVTDKLKDYGKQVKDNIVSKDLSAGVQTTNALLNAGKDIIDPWNIAREAQTAASKSANSSAAKNFKSLPQNTQDTMIFDYQKNLTEVEQMEITVLNTTDQVKKRELAVELLFRWKEVANKASAMGKTEDAERAAAAAKKWAEYLSSSSSSFEPTRKDHYLLLALKGFNSSSLDPQAGLARINQTSTDLHAYIAFYEWKKMSEGLNRSFTLAEYQILKDTVPAVLFNNKGSLKGALVTILSFQVMSEVYASGMGGKIGSLAGNMALGVLKTQALRFALCAVAPKQAMIVSKWLQTPYAVAVMATASAAVNFQLAGVAKKEKNQAEKNAEIIKKIIANFEITQAAYCPGGRDDVSNPQCYCYTESGERSSHTNSETCQALWAKDDKNYFADASTENSSSGGCVYINGKYDLKCNCTKLIDKTTGENACLKTTKVANGTTGISTANAGNINSLANSVGTLANGSTAAAGIDTASLYNNALTQKKVNEQMADNLNKSLKKKGQSSLKLGTDAAQNAWTNGLVPAGNTRAQLMKLSSQGDAGFSGKNALPPKAKEALIKAMKKTGIQYNGGGSSSKKKGKDDYSYLFESSNSSSKKVQNFDEAEKKYNYNNNDINTQSGASLFEIISHRFSTSAMRRLFGEQN